jgi:hypothetical protein
MGDKPSAGELATTLTEAGSAHHEYETESLGGVRDKQWAAFYAAFVLGRLGGFALPSVLTRWLEEAPAGEDWSTATAEHVLKQL